MKLNSEVKLMEKTEIFVPLLSWLIGGSRIGGGYNYKIPSDPPSVHRNAPRDNHERRGYD